MEYANQVAKVGWNSELNRYELNIFGLKAYTSGESQAEHDKGKVELIRMASEKGYTVIEG